jgi:hypothetical protein
MKLATAYYCSACQEIFERAPYGSCPRCASQDISSLSWLVKSAAEREAWLHRIHGSAKRSVRPEAKPAFAYSCLDKETRIEAEIN